jgi:hypothetical protein
VEFEKSTCAAFALRAKWNSGTSAAFDWNEVSEMVVHQLFMGGLNLRTHFCSLRLEGEVDNGTSAAFDWPEGLENVPYSVLLQLLI